MNTNALFFLLNGEFALPLAGVRNGEWTAA
jgi:hypothetical protein